MENKQTASAPIKAIDRPDAMQSLEEKIKMRWLMLINIWKRFSIFCLIQLMLLTRKDRW